MVVRGTNEPHGKEVMSELLTIKGARVLITSRGVDPTRFHRDAVHAAVNAPASNAVKGTPDRQALAMYLIALIALIAKEGGLAPRSKAAKVKWEGPHFVVNASTMEGAPSPAPEGWNSQSYLKSAIKWAAGIAGVDHLQVGFCNKGPHTYGVYLQEMER